MSGCPTYVLRSWHRYSYYLMNPQFTHFSKGGSSSLGLNSDGLCPALENLVNVLLTKFGPFILLIHDGPVGTSPQQILNLLLRQLLLHCLEDKEKWS